MYSRIGTLIKLDGLIPSKKNSRITNRRTGQSFPSPAYRKWHGEAFRQVAEHYHSEGKPGIEKCRAVHIHLFFGTLRRADLTNKAESIMDLLVDSGVLADDNWRVVPRLLLTSRYRKGLDGALVRLV